MSKVIFRKVNKTLKGDGESLLCLRILCADHAHHFLGKVQDGKLHLYCSKCRKFFEVQILSKEDMANLIDK